MTATDETASTEPRKHPAKFSPPILDAIVELCADILPPGSRVLDPFAGVGGIHRLAEPPLKWRTLGVEIEEEWASQHPRTYCGDSTQLMDVLRHEINEQGQFDAIVTSPAYGNRMADRYDGRDGSKRHTYRIDLGRELAANNGAGMQWGPEYQKLHRAVWAECMKVLRFDGYFILNIKDHIRGKVVVPVSRWHRGVLEKEGLRKVAGMRVPTAEMRHGENGDARLGFEHVWVFRKDPF